MEPAQPLDLARLVGIQHEYRSGSAEMSGLGDPNKTPNGVVIGLAQLQLAVVAKPDDLSAHTVRIDRQTVGDGFGSKPVAEPRARRRQVLAAKPSRCPRAAANLSLAKESSCSS